MAVAELTAEEVKARARELGVDLVGIAAAEALDAHSPHPDAPHRPRAVLHGARSVVVLALRIPWGGARLAQWNNRSHHFVQELALTKIEEAAVELVWWIEEHGHPSLVVPGAVSRSLQADQERDGPLSLTHAAVEAGLGTLGLNGMLLTPEYGPRVVLGAVITLAPLAPDRRHTEALCLGEQCGRCLLACPGDAIGAWALDVERCRPHSSPWGYQKVQEHFGAVFAGDADERRARAASTDSFMIWQSMLRGVGVYTGCTRCYDVCPVGADYAPHLADALNAIPEATPAKEERLAALRAAAEAAPPAARQRAARWIGEPPHA